MSLSISCHAYYTRASLAQRTHAQTEREREEASFLPLSRGDYCAWQQTAGEERREERADACLPSTHPSTPARDARRQDTHLPICPQNTLTDPGTLDACRTAHVRTTHTNTHMHTCRCVQTSNLQITSASQVHRSPRPPPPNTQTKPGKRHQGHLVQCLRELDPSWAEDRRAVLAASCHHRETVIPILLTKHH